ncbi:hypothetical protein EDC94DRAFT_691496 [Helicostylum pulchrum]|nr:hypothetical protein EDC94DRAFT_691496 [Helicostylum pulchrum]
MTYHTLTKKFGTNSLDIQDLCLRVNIQYLETITSLELRALKEELTAIKYSGLVKLISQFPRLTCLKLSSFFTWTEADKFLNANPISNVDIKHLFEENPPLKDVELNSCAIFASSWKYGAYTFNKVKSLRLRVGKITVDETVLEEEFVVILCNLIACTSEMERVKIKYNYNGEEFYYDRGNNDDSSGNYSYYYGYPSDYDYDDSDYDYDSDDYGYTDVTMDYRDCIDEYCYYFSD